MDVTVDGEGPPGDPSAFNLPTSFGELVSTCPDIFPYLRHWLSDVSGIKIPKEVDFANNIFVNLHEIFSRRHLYSDSAIKSLNDSIVSNIVILDRFKSDPCRDSLEEVFTFTTLLNGASTNFASSKLSSKNPTKRSFSEVNLQKIAKSARDSKRQFKDSGLVSQAISDDKYDDDYSPWVFPAKPAKLNPSPTPSEVTTNNPFDPLKNNENEMDDSDNSTNLPIKIPKPEPISLKINPNWRETVTHINHITKTEIDKKFIGNTLKFFPQTIEQYRIIQKYFEDERLEYFTLSLKNERPKKIIIKGLPTDITTDEIRSELSTLNFSTSRISQLKNFKSKIPLPIFLIDLIPSPDFARIFDISTFLGFKIKFEAYSFKGTKQCYNCQHFNHGSDSCKFKPICVKCAGNHKSKDCSVSDRIQIKCANCGDNHTANFSGCPQNPKNLKRNKILTINNAPTTISSPDVIIRNTYTPNANNTKDFSLSLKDNTEFPPLTNNTPTPPGFTKLIHPEFFKNIDIFISKIKTAIELLEKLKNLSVEMGFPITSLNDTLSNFSTVNKTLSSNN